MDSGFRKKMKQAGEGKEIFKQIFDVATINAEDAFILMLAHNEETIRCGAKYLPDFIRIFNKRNVYVLMDNEKYMRTFSDAGGSVKICKKEELLSLAMYLNIFHDKEFRDTRIIFLRDKDGYGVAMEELIDRRYFSIEEYVAISLYQLEKLREEGI